MIAFKTIRLGQMCRAALAAALVAMPIASGAAAQEAEFDSRITSPVQEFGHPIGEDYFLATYQQLIGYWEKLSRESDRMVLDTIGYSEEGRPQLMAIITDPANHADLERYRAIAERMARAEGVSESQARELAAEGKAVIWIDGGLHATEVLGAQQLMELVYHLNSRTDAETTRILRDVIVLAAHANPDGHDLVADWYMRHDDPLQRSTRGIPVLYQKYAGHDNNRDFYMGNLAETRNMSRMQYQVWYPQIIFNHHQTGPAGTIVFAPPFRDPPNHNLDPMILTSLDQVGSAMHARFVREGKGGTTMRSGASYSTWWNGGLRTTPYFHNMIGLLTETIGHPTPIEVPFIPSRQITHGDLPLPVNPGPWHFRQSVEYSLTSNYAVLDHASRLGDQLLFNIWRMGTNAIERGRGDSWTILPSQIEAAAQELPQREGFGGSTARGDAADFERLMRQPDRRDARAYVLPSDQPDFLTATKFVNVLMQFGVDVHRATTGFSAAGNSYPEGSYVLKTAQAFAPHLIDMMEPQDHPNDFAFPGAPPTAPYDNAGWTLALQMGVEFDRFLEEVDGPFEKLEGPTAPPAGVVAGDASEGYLLRHDVNDAFVAVNRLLAEGKDVHWMRGDVTVSGETWPAGTFFIPQGGGVADIVGHAAHDLGLRFTGIDEVPTGATIELDKVRIGLWDRYGGSMPSGWTRFVLERFEFPFRLVYPAELDAGDLRREFDVIILPDGAVSDGGFGFGGPPQADAIPEEFHDRLGRITTENTLPQLREFMENGGAVVAIGTSTRVGHDLGLPIENYLVDAAGEPLSDEHYYVPGSVLDMKIDGDSPLTHGIGDRANVLFSRSPVFRVGAGAVGIRQIGSFDRPDPLLSGWAWGQDHLEGGAAMLEADIGQGKLFLFGPKVLFRGQSHGTFPLVFNAIYYGSSQIPPVS